MINRRKNRIRRTCTSAAIPGSSIFIFEANATPKISGPYPAAGLRRSATSAGGDVADGALVVNGKRWINKQWVLEARAEKIEDPLFSEAMAKFLDWYKTENVEYTFTKYATPAAKNLKAYLRNDRPN